MPLLTELDHLFADHPQLRLLATLSLLFLAAWLSDRLTRQVLAILPEFGLRVFQQPAGAGLRHLVLPFRPA